MEQPEKKPENKPESTPPPPKLDAILPDVPEAAAELVEDIGTYQKRIENEWETAKAAYEDKINRIMDEFMSTNNAFVPPPAPPPRTEQKDKNNDRIKKIMGQLEAELQRPGKPFSQSSMYSSQSPEAMQLEWQGGRKRLHWGLIAGLLSALLVVGTTLAYLNFWRVQVVSLPYSHCEGPVLFRNEVYIVDWFRKALYIHTNTLELPIRAVETFPNTLVSGLAISEKTIWSLDAMSLKIQLHALSSDHQVTSMINAPGPKPVGLFYDGTDLWSADTDEKTLYRHRGNDLEDIRDRFPLPDVGVTWFAFHNSRLWILDGKARTINVYRLQKPMRQLASFDLDPFVKGATPTGFSIAERKLLLVTENPSTLTRIPLTRLRNSTTDSF